MERLNGFKREFRNFPLAETDEKQRSEDPFLLVWQSIQSVITTDFLRK